MSLLSEIGGNLNAVIEFMGYLIFTFIGSLLKEIYNTNNAEDDYEFKPDKVISSAIAASFTCLLLRSKFLAEYDYAVMSFVSFTLGLLGFEIFKHLCSIRTLKAILNGFNGIDKVLTEEEKEKKKKKDKTLHHDNNDEDDILNHNQLPNVFPTIHIHIPHEDDKDKNDDT
jgi:hypothetical protein